MSYVFLFDPPKQNNIVSLILPIKIILKRSCDKLTVKILIEKAEIDQNIGNDCLN